jgi:hypothetical protein
LLLLLRPRIMLALLSLPLASLAPQPQRRVPGAKAEAKASSTFQQHATNMLQAGPPEVTFKAWPALNDDDIRLAVNAGRRFRLHLHGDPNIPDPTLELFHGDSLMNRFARALAAKKAIDRKEFFEACEFFARVRSKLRADEGVGILVDCAGGHGLVGTLAAIFMFRQFNRIIIRDPKKPKAFDAVVEAAVEVAPWVEGRIVFEQAWIGPMHGALPRGCAIVGVHGCRDLTDKIIAAAADADARAVALMPCCYKSTAADAPEALRLSLGVPLAADVHRTYVLEQLGFTVKWSAIPTCISPMNRIILASRVGRGGDDHR